MAKKEKRPKKAKEPKKANKKRTSYRPVQSTQQNIPVRDFVDGMVVTKDNRFIMMMEVQPQPFFLKKNRDQNKVYSYFSNLLKSAPDELHFKSIAIQSDLTYHIEDVKEHIASEENENCRKMGEEYLGRLEEAQTYGVTRRFTVSFPYLGVTAGINKPTYDDILFNLKVDAGRLEQDLGECGNKVLHTENDDARNVSIFYTLYNRDRYLKEPFMDRLNGVYSDYYEKSGGKQVYVPPVDIIAPEKISYEDSKYLVINDTYYNFLYVPSYGYNPKVYTGWLDIFINSYNGVDVDLFMKRISKEKVMHKIRMSVGNSGANIDESKENSEAFDKSISTLRSATYLKDGLSSGQDFYYIATLITVSGKSPEDVAFKVNEIKKTARKCDMVVNENTFQMERTFNMTLPTATWDDEFFEKMKRNVLTNAAASMYPFTTFQIADENGLYIADDLRLNTPVIIDFFDRKRVNNPHIFINGETGAGKSVTVMLMALRARVKGKRVFILAPDKQHEFKRLVNAVGGQFISLGSGSPHRINIMEIFKKDERSIKKAEQIDGESEEVGTSYLSEKIAILIEFIQLYINDISIEEKQLLNEAIIDTYGRFGITMDNDSLWADETHTSYKKMPVLSDLVKTLEEKRDTMRLARSVKLLTSGAGAHFDGQTNINVNNQFFVIGLEHNTQEMLGLSIYVAMNYCWSKIKEDRTKEELFIMDEWWKMAKNPIAAERSFEIIKLARAYSCSVIIATQQMSDILSYQDGKYGMAVLNNCATNILLRMKYKDVMSVSDMIDLSKKEEDTITKLQMGTGLLIAGETRMFLRFTPSETEKLLTFTDQKTLEKYIEVEEIKKQKKAEEEKIRNAEHFDDLFGSIIEDLPNLEDALSSYDSSSDKESSHD